jgi:hypothetical protein
MSRPWFDAETGILKLDEYLCEDPSFRKVMEDGIVTDDELAAHAEAVAESLRALEASLDAPARDRVLDTLIQLCALYALQRAHEQQDLVRGRL